jgi:dTDP-4-dehydrorhamnose reductase
MPRILLTGKTGQIGYELERSLQGLGEITALDRSQMDLADLAQVRDVIRQVKPNLIINPAAYTAVDKAESEPDLAMRINGEAPGVMAEEAKKLGAVMIHYSTDYVFDGSKSTPYVETDPTCPINLYGVTKLAGEQAIQAVGVPHLILRTSWVYGMRRRNFVLTILRMAGEKDELRIVDDRYGSPTWCRIVADITADLVVQSAIAKKGDDWWRQYSGIYHLTARGWTTWYGFAQAILDLASLKAAAHLVPITTSEYAAAATRPASSILSSERLESLFDVNPPDWRSALQLCLETAKSLRRH